MNSDEFLACARHPDFPTAFTRQRKLTLPTVVATMLCGMRASVQAELDQFFANLRQQTILCRHVSEQAFAQARAKLSARAFEHLNHWLIGRADALLPRWHGHRLVAGDASHVRFGIRASHVPRAADADQIAFGLYLPGADMMLSASLHSIHEAERQMLFEQLDNLAPDDLLLLDRGYPASWLVAVLNALQRSFCMRVDGAGFKQVQAFLRSDLAEEVVVLSAPTSVQAGDYDCPAVEQAVRLIRQITPDGKVRVLMTNLFDTERYPAADFAQLYHQRWRIEEAFKRLKHRLKLEHVSGLSQLAVRQDFAAKVLCDNLHALACLVARVDHEVPAHRIINRSYAITALRAVLPGLLLGCAWACPLLHDVISLIATRSHRHRPGRSKPRPPRPKPHLHAAYKAC